MIWYGARKRKKKCHGLCFQKIVLFEKWDFQIQKITKKQKRVYAHWKICFDEKCCGDSQRGMKNLSAKWLKQELMNTFKIIASFIQIMDFFFAILWYSHKNPLSKTKHLKFLYKYSYNCRHSIFILSK